MAKKQLQRPLAAGIFALASLTVSHAQTFSARDLYAQGQEALAKQSYYEAAERFKQALESNPNYADARLGAAKAYFFLGENQEALAQLEKYEAFATSSEARTLQGRVYASLGRRAEAEAIFKEILSKEPNNIDAQFGMAEVSLLTGRSETAIREIKALLSHAPDNRRALLSLVLLYDDKLQFNNAEPYISQAVFYFPHDPLVLFTAGQHYQKTRNWTQALRYYEAAAAIRPSYPRLAERKAQTLLGMGRYQEAATELEETIRGAGRRDANVWSILAEIFERQGNIEQALQCYSEALRLAPNDELARLAAENLIKTSTPVNSKERDQYAQYRLNLGRQYQASYLNERALREYRKGLLLSPENASIRFAYGQLLAKSSGHFSYLAQLQLMKQEGKATQRMLDILEREERRKVPSLAADWGVTQGPQGVPIKLAVTRLAGQSQLERFGADGLLQSAWVDALNSYTRLDAANLQESSSFTEAWRNARQYEADFFTVARYVERERKFYAEYSLYLTSTGALINSYSVSRSSAAKIDESLTLAARQLEANLPVKTQILRRQGSKALIGLGRFNSIKEGDRFIVIKSQSGRFTSAPPFFEYLGKDELGQISITALDEYVAEGSIESSSRSSIIAQEDEVYLLKDSASAPAAAQPPQGIPEGFFSVH